MENESIKQGVLRVWRKEEIHSVEGNYDDCIIDITQNLHNDREAKGFFKLV